MHNPCLYIMERNKKLCENASLITVTWNYHLICMKICSSTNGTILDMCANYIETLPQYLSLKKQSIKNNTEEIYYHLSLLLVLLNLCPLVPLLLFLIFLEWEPPANTQAPPPVTHGQVLKDSVQILGILTVDPFLINTHLKYF